MWRIMRDALMHHFTVMGGRGMWKTACMLAVAVMSALAAVRVSYIITKPDAFHS